MKSRLRTWGLLGAAAYAALRLSRPWISSWGASEQEKTMPVPGAEHLHQPRITATHSITIDAPHDEVWSWLVQIGVGRGGFYSYAWLENLVGCGVRNVDEIKPELQNLREGDHVTLHPKARPLRVTRLEKGRVLALEGWIFYLIPLGLAQTRLIVRTYAEATRAGASWSRRIGDRMVQSVWFDLAHFVMQRKQLREIKRLAENAYRRSPAMRLAQQA